MRKGLHRLNAEVVTLNMQRSEPAKKEPPSSVGLPVSLLTSLMRNRFEQRVGQTLEDHWQYEILRLNSRFCIFA